MKGILLGLLLGAIIGYAWGFGDAKEGKPSVMARALDRFGVSQVKDARATREREVESTARP